MLKTVGSPDARNGAAIASPAKATMPAAATFAVLTFLYPSSAMISGLTLIIALKTMTVMILHLYLLLPEIYSCRGHLP